LTSLPQNILANKEKLRYIVDMGFKGPTGFEKLIKIIGLGGRLR